MATFIANGGVEFVLGIGALIFVLIQNRFHDVRDEHESMANNFK